MKVRDAVESDSERIQDLVTQLGHPLGVDCDRFGSFFISVLSDDNQIVLVVEDEGEVLGYVSTRIHTPLYAQSKAAFIDEIVIDEKRRGEGIGSMLMKSLEKRASDEGCVLCSLATAGAKVFYEGLGYGGRATYLKRSL